MKKDIVDYLDVGVRADQRRSIQIEREIIAGFVVLHLWISEKKWLSLCGKEQKWLQHYRHKLRCRLWRYDLERCAVCPDERIEELFAAPHLGFEARKAELLARCADIFGGLRAGVRTSGRATFLLYIEDRTWSPSEIYKILISVKDFYEELVIVCRGEYELGRIRGRLLEECGIALRILDERQVGNQYYQGALLLLKKRNNRIARQIGFENAYLVARSEAMEMLSERVRRTKNQKVHPGVCYSGLCYEKEGIEIPYPMAVAMLYQNVLSEGKNSISSVAIYEVE